MSHEETELISILRTSADPAQAMITAIQIISDFLQQCESCQAPFPAYPQERA